MTKRETEQYEAGYRYGAGLARNYGIHTLLRVTRMGYVNGSKAYTAGMVDAGLRVAQSGVK